MFGLEKKKKDPEEFVFELEKELKDKRKQREIKERVNGQVLKLKKTLRSGEDKENFDRYGALLHGYTALLKVIARTASK